MTSQLEQKISEDNKLISKKGIENFESNITMIQATGQRNVVLDENEIGDLHVNEDTFEMVLQDINTGKKYLKIVAHKEMIFVCKICGKTFKDKSFSEAHITIHNNETDEIKKSYKCKTCDKAFHSGVNCRKPSNFHPDSNKFSCKICSESFQDTRLLETHMLTHTNMKQKCQLCDKGFDTTLQLKRHMAFECINKCRSCGKMFSSSTKLTMHMLVHSEQPTYICVYCSKRFISLKTLEAHTIIHNLDNTICCNKCDMEFASRSTLNQHILKHHKYSDRRKSFENIEVLMLEEEKREHEEEGEVKEEGEI